MFRKRPWEGGVSSAEIKEPKWHVFEPGCINFVGTGPEKGLGYCLCSTCFWQNYWLVWWMCITQSGNSSLGSHPNLPPNLAWWMHMASPDKKPFWHSLAIPMLSFVILLFSPRLIKYSQKARNLWEYQMLSSDEQQAACSLSLMSTSTFTSTETGDGYVGFTVVLVWVLTAPGEILLDESTLPLYCGHAS